MTRQALSGASLFDAVLAVRPCARSRHFFVHHLPPPVESPAHAGAPASELSTGLAPGAQKVVDEPAWRLGMIVPKRHAKRSVTRTLVKRRIRELWRARLSGLPPGDWVVRLTAPIDRKAWPSAASAALDKVLTDELLVVLADAARRSMRTATSSPGRAAAAGPSSTGTPP